MPDEKTEIDDEYSGQDGERQVRAYRVPGIPEDHLELDHQHVDDEQEDKTIVIPLEFLIVLPERVDAGEDREQPGKTRHDKGNDGKAP